MSAKIRRASVGTLCAITSALALNAGVASAQTTASPTLTSGRINIGYRVEAAPFSLRNASGQASGYMVELCQKIAAGLRSTGGRPLRINYVAVPSDQVVRYMSGKTVDVLCSATTDTTERRASMSFSKPLFVAAIKVLVRDADGYTSVEQLRGQPVVVIGRTTAEAIAAEQASNLQWKTTRVLDGVAAMGQLQLGWAKGYARDDILLLTQLAQRKDPNTYRLLPEALSRENIAIAVRRDDPTLLESVNQAIAAAVKSGELDAVYAKWFTKPIAPFNRSLNLPMSAELKAEFDKLR